jgi:hypothetical protein
MNIFYIQSDPILAAQQMVNRHTVKMILESGQILSTTHRVIDGKKVQYIKTAKNGKKKVDIKLVLPDDREHILYKTAHVNHPSTIWARQSIENYNWLVQHTLALGEEFTYRYGKIHKTIQEVLPALMSPPNNLIKTEFTKMPCCMDDQYIISDDPIVNYRNYYANGKKDLHQWKNREKPEWIKDYEY